MPGAIPISTMASSMIPLLTFGRSTLELPWRDASAPESHEGLPGWPSESNTVQGNLLSGDHTRSDEYSLKMTQAHGRAIIPEIERDIDARWIWRRMKLGPTRCRQNG